MALTITRDNDGYSRIGNKYRVSGTMTFDSSYATSGEAITAAALGLAVIDELNIEAASGYIPRWDKSGATVLVYMGQPDVLSVNTTAVASSATTSAQNLMTYSLPASTLGTNGQGVKVKAWGTSAGTTETKNYKLLFGSATILDTGADADNANDWYMEATVIRTGSATQEVVAWGSNSATFLVPNQSAPTEDLTAAVTIKVTLTQGAAETGSTQEGMTVELIGLTYAAQREVPSGTDLSAVVFRYVATGV